MSRPSWDGFLRFNLISLPVKAYNAAASGGGKVGFHLLHANCGQRIRYKKVCPVHGEVENDEIVSGYEVSKGQYVTVDKEERGQARVEDDKAISVDTFVSPDAIDPIFYSGRSFYLVPDGKVAQKPYELLLAAMRENDRYAVAQVVFSGRGQVAVVRPAKKVLAMTLLEYENQVQKPEDFESLVEHPAISEQERKLAQSLLEASTAKEFDLESYRDEYTRRLMKLIEGKAKRQKPAALRKDQEPGVINLMDALRESLNRTGKKSRNGQHGKTSRKKAAAANGHPRAVGRKKTA